MKKNYVLVILSLCTYWAGAQSIAPKVLHEKQVTRIDKKNPSMDEANARTVPVNPNLLNMLHHNSSSSISSPASASKLLISSSKNLYSVISSFPQAITVNPDLNMISFVHRLCNSYTGASGDIQATFSKDRGLTWDSTLVVYRGDGAYSSSRYPNGGIFNPAGNTDPNAALAVVSGPITDNAATATWFATYIASERFDSTDGASVVYDNKLGATTPQYLNRNDYSVGGNNAYTLGYHGIDDGSIVPYNNGAVVNKGNYNAATDAFDWSQIYVPVHFAQDPADGSQIIAMQGRQAWSADGQIGYVVFMGVDSIDQQGPYKPIVSKTIDGGTTWTQLPDFDFGSIPAIQENVWASATDTLVHPNYIFASELYYLSNGMDLGVDANGNLHIVGTVLGGVGNSPDSSGFILTDANGDYEQLVFDTYTTETGWDAMLIDTIKTYPMSGAGEAVYADGLTWGARIQLAWSADRTKFFEIWMDSDPTLGPTNYTPDILGRGWSIYGGLTPIINFTRGGNYDENNYWLYSSNEVLSDGQGNYTIPCTTSQPQDLSNLDGTLPANHYYVGGITFSNDDFVGVPVVVKHTFSVSAIAPNPVGSTSVFSVNLDKASKVNVQVMNILGGTVMTKNYNFSSGSHQVILSKDQLPSGIYFYTVKVGNDKITNKFVVD